MRDSNATSATISLTSFCLNENKINYLARRMRTEINEK